MLEFLLRLAKALAAQFGPSCEIVIHDLKSNDPDSSIVAIENGHVSGRKVGDGPSHVVLEALAVVLDGQWWNIDRHLTLQGTRASADALYLDCIKQGVTTIFDHLSV